MNQNTDPIEIKSPGFFFQWLFHYSANSVLQNESDQVGYAGFGRMT